jgi:4-amino-4-deoxy-L-arabinose transferase-like glycosyltransferase
LHFSLSNVRSFTIVENLARSTIGSCLLLAFIAAGTLFFRLGGLPLIGADEPRYAGIAAEMMLEDRWVTPVLEHRPWLEKPPLYYWITIPIFRVAGQGEATARLGPALAAFWTALVIYWLGSTLWSRLAGLIGGSALLTMVGFAAFGRSASTDLPMTACMTTVLAMLAVAAVREDLAGWRVLAGYVFLGLAILAKGPVALILAAGVGACYWALDPRMRLRRWHPVAGLVIALAVSLPWFWLAFRQNGFGFILVFFINHNLARYVTDIHHHSQPFFYFIPITLGLIFPWSFWLLFSASRAGLRKLRQWRDWNPANLFLGCWILFPLVFFSISRSKLPGYVLPILPPLALVLGATYASWIEHGRPRRRGAAVGHLLGSAVVGAGVMFALRTRYGAGWEPGALIALLTLLPALAGGVAAVHGRWRTAAIATTLQGVVSVMAFVVVASPYLASVLSARDIALAALSDRPDGEEIVTYRYFHHGLDYYTGYQVASEIESPAELAQFAEKKHRFLVVTQQRWLPEIRQLKCCTIQTLAEQGYLRLIRVTGRSSTQ